MKTVVVSIEEPILEAIDRLAHAAQQRIGRRGGSRRRRPNRSEVIRLALRDFVLSHERQEREDRERRILAEHRVRLARQAAALVAEQARP